MADDKNLATLKVTVTADKSPLKKALDSAKKDTEKSTSQIQRILQKIRKTLSSVSLKVMVKDFQVKSGIKVPTQEFQELREEAGKARDALADLLEKQKKLEALGVKEQSREWKSLQYDIEKAKNAVEGYKAEMSEMKANGADVERPVSLPKQAMGLGKSVVGGIGKVAGLGASAVSKGWGGLVRILGGVTSAFSKVGGVIRRTSGLFGALIQKFTSGIPILNRFTGGVKDNGSSFGGGLKNLLKYSLGIRSLFALVNKLRSALVDGFKNLSQYSGDTNNSLSMLMSSLTQLKNAFAAAFAAALSVQTGRPLKLSAAVKIAGKCKRRVHMEKTWTRLSPRFGKGGQMFYARFLSSAFSRYSPLASPPRRSNLAMRSAVLFSSSPCSATNHSRNWQARKSSLSRACL